MRAIAAWRTSSFNTVDKLLREAGEACEAFHDRTVRGVKSKRVQCDEIRAFVHAKAKNVPTAKASGRRWRFLDLDGVGSRKQTNDFLGGRQSGC